MGLLGIEWSKTFGHFLDNMSHHECTLTSLFGDEKEQARSPTAQHPEPAGIGVAAAAVMPPLPPPTSSPPSVLLVPSAGPFAETAFLRQQLDATSKGFVASLVRSNLIEHYHRQHPQDYQHPQMHQPISPSLSKKKASTASSTSSTNKSKTKISKKKAPTEKSRAESPLPPPPAPTISLEMLPDLLKAFDATTAYATGTSTSSNSNSSGGSSSSGDSGSSATAMIDEIDSDVAKWRQVLMEAPRSVTTPVRKWHEKVRTNSLSSSATKQQQQ